MTTRSRLDELAAIIRQSLIRAPDDFAFREPLWMERDRLNRQTKEPA